jgi:hypothetical protein
MKAALGILIFLGLCCFGVTAQQAGNARTLRPDDLFKFRRVGAIAWSPDGQYATIEFSKPSRWLDDVPANDLSLLDVKSRSLRPLSQRSPAHIGFFNAVWSRDSRRVAFLSVDQHAVVRAWVWTIGATTVSLVPNVEPRIGLNDLPLAWIDGDRLETLVMKTTLGITITE